MRQVILGWKSPLLATSILLGGLWLAGCDEHGDYSQPGCLGSEASDVGMAAGARQKRTKE